MSAWLLEIDYGKVYVDDEQYESPCKLIKQFFRKKLKSCFNP